jgi:hypothetical protein
MIYLMTQWAAVRIRVGEMIVPPQNTPDPNFLRPTWNTNSTTNQFNNYIVPYVRYFHWITYEKRPRIRDSFGSTENPDIWEGTLRWWSRSDTTGNFLLPRIRWSCCSIIDIRKAAGRLVERIRLDQKVWMLLVREARVRIDCVHYRDWWRICEKIAQCKRSPLLFSRISGPRIINCTLFE